MLNIIEVTAESQYLDTIRTLFREYQDFLGIDLDFQDFEKEMSSLPGKFAPPGGRLYLALWDNLPAGCTAFYAMNDKTCELKRLFVRPDFQGKAIGRKLLERAIEDAKAAGYQFMRLDSLRRLETAGRMYPQFQFYEIAPYKRKPA